MISIFSLFLLGNLAVHFSLFSPRRKFYTSNINKNIRFYNFECCPRHLNCNGSSRNERQTLKYSRDAFQICKISKIEFFSHYSSIDHLGTLDWEIFQAQTPQTLKLKFQPKMDSTWTTSIHKIISQITKITSYQPFTIANIS